MRMILSFIVYPSIFNVSIRYQLEFIAISSGCSVTIPALSVPIP